MNSHSNDYKHIIMYKKRKEIAEACFDLTKHENLSNSKIILVNPVRMFECS